MSGRALVASLVCVGLAGCVTDKIAMSSEVGGGGSSSVFARSADSGRLGGEDGDAGLGVTGGGGVLDNVVGADPVGGLLDGLGPDNPIDALLGSGSDGLIPSAAAALAGDPDAEVVGLGILGEGGLLADLAGTDFLGGTLDTSGVLTASIAGGNDGLLGVLLDGRIGDLPLAPVTDPVVAALPSSALDGALAQLPALGLTGSDGLIADLTGSDFAGNLLGPETPLGGGNNGQLGDIVPAGEPPLGYVGDLTNGLLNIAAGNDPSPADSLLAPAVPVLENILGTGASIVGDVAAPVTGALGSVPIVGGVVGAPSSTAPATGASSTASGILAPVTGLVGGLAGGF